MKLLWLSLYFVIFLSAPAQARNAFVESLNKKIEVKKQTRWTLADWLGTKKKVDIMDSWLAVNSSSSVFEFYLEASQLEYDEVKPYSYLAAGFVSIFGVRIQQEIYRQEVFSSAEGLLRLFGKAEQSTRLNLFYGLKIMDESVYLKTYERPYWGGELRIYLLSFLSIDGRYLNYIPSETPENLKISGYEWHYGLNIDLGPLQFFGQMLNEVTSVSGTNQIKIDGHRYGVRLYF